MNLVKMRRVTIIAEALIADRIVDDVLAQGASGYTRTDAGGRGSRGVRASEWEGKNAKIEALVRPDVCEKILACMAEKYFEHFAVVAYAHDVEVVRGDKY